MNASTLQNALETNGEIMVTVEEFDTPLELHLHDTEIEDDVVVLELADGELTFAIDAVTGYWHHYHSSDDYGL